MMIETVGCITLVQMRTFEYAHNSVGNSSTSLAHLEPMEQTVLMDKMVLTVLTVLMDKMVLTVLTVLMDKMVLMELMVPTEWMARMAHQSSSI